MVDTQNPKFWEGYDWTLSRIKEERRFFIQALEIESVMKEISPDSLLAVGCGSGRLFPYYAPYSKHVTAIDLTPSRVDTACQYTDYLGYDNIDINCMNFLENRYKDGQYDTIICIGVLLHIPHSLIKKFISELIRVAKRDIIIISWYHPDLEALIKRNGGRTNLRGQYFIHDYPELFKDPSLNLEFFNERRIFDEQYLFGLVKK